MQDINKGSLKIINEFVLQNHHGILLSGPSCIGKTTFGRTLKQHDDFVGTPDFPKLPMRWVIASETVADIQRIAVEKCMKQLTKFEQGLSARHSNERMEKHKNKIKKRRESHHITDGKGVIVLGVPFSVWKERNYLRDRHPDWTKRTAIEFKKKYARYIEKLEEFKISHIFVDNRNDYPILNKLSFLDILEK